MISNQLSSNVIMYQGDALQILSALPDESVDAVLTDPPYSSGGITLGTRQADPAHKYQSSGTRRTYPPMLGDAKDQRSWTRWCALWLAECWRLAKAGAPLLVFTDWRQLPSMTDAMQAAGWKWLGIVPWDKHNARPQIGKFRQQCEYILFGCKGRFIPATRQCLPGLYTASINALHKVHLTSKPVGLLRELLTVAKPGCTVLDPFMGGGNVGIACVGSERGFVGIELSKDYYQIASDRIAETASRAKQS